MFYLFQIVSTQSILNPSVDLFALCSIPNKAELLNHFYHNMADAEAPTHCRWPGTVECHDDDLMYLTVLNEPNTIHIVCLITGHI